MTSSKKRKYFKFKPGRDKLYLQKWLDRDTITAKQYNRFLKMLKHKEAKAALTAHQISIIKVVMLKYNKAGGDDTYRQPVGLSGIGGGRRYTQSAY